MVEEEYTELWPGIIVCTIIAVISFVTSIIYNPVSSLMWAFIYSILITNLVRIPKKFLPGITFCSKDFLKGVIAALGIVTSALVWLEIGIGVINALIVIFFSFFISLWLGKKIGLNTRLATLIGIGTSICGASAIAAMAPCIEAKEEETGLALACITLFGVLAMFFYPLLYTNTIIGNLLGHNLSAYAIWVGTGVHETAQVAAAAGALGVEGEALLIKSLRIFMIGPMILLAARMMARKNNLSKKRKTTLPAYSIVFIALSICCAFLDIYTPQIEFLGFDWLLIKTMLSKIVFKFLLGLCLAGVGFKVKFSQISKLGITPFAVGAFVALLAGIVALILAILVTPLLSI